MNLRSRDSVDCVIVTPHSSNRFISSSCEQMNSERIILRMIDSL